jgi:hypothetical protein
MLGVRVRISVERQENTSGYTLSLFCIIRKISTFCDVDICTCRYFDTSLSTCVKFFLFVPSSLGDLLGFFLYLYSWWLTVQARKKTAITKTTFSPLKLNLFVFFFLLWISFILLHLSSSLSQLEWKFFNNMKLDPPLFSSLLRD